MENEENSENFWGLYRSNLYFGVKSTFPNGLNTGLMWITWKNQQLLLRHWAQDSDGLKSYKFHRHDTQFAQQEIYDETNFLNLSFVKDLSIRKKYGKSSGVWTKRIHGKCLQKMSILLYVAIDRPVDESIAYLQVDRDPTTKELIVRGKSPEISISNGIDETSNLMEIRFRVKENFEKWRISMIRSNIDGLLNVDETIKNNIRGRKTKENMQIPVLSESIDVIGDKKKTNFVAIMFYLAIPRNEIQIDMSFVPRSLNLKKMLIGNEFTKQLEWNIREFDKKFNKTFPLVNYDNFHPDKHFHDFSKYLLSNLLGGVGYFSGRMIVKSTIPNYSEIPTNYFFTNLLTAVPSRSFFPRGFLWDEGFHSLIYGKWNRLLQKQILMHWFKLMNGEGWIPREVILGQEALSKVPNEFIVQNHLSGNPPTFLLVIDQLLKEDNNNDFLLAIRPYIYGWINWYDTHQRSNSKELLTTYRWNVRDKNSDELILNPKSLASGLDDYPRSSHVTEFDRHVDLHCWMILAMRIILNVDEKLKLNDELTKEIKEKYSSLNDWNNLNRLFWWNEKKRFADYGYHSTRCRLVRVRKDDNFVTKRICQDKPKYQFVDAEGYVSLFPFLFQLIPPDNQQLNFILDSLINPKIFWTSYGIRSLSTKAPLYQKRNTEHDPPYWRGAIWINFNYLILRSLNYYSNEKNCIEREKNVYDQYLRTNYVWENYNDDDGKGRGTHPFTGWTSLILLVISEKY
ncbi:hypothetical protein SNEBB_010943 [Seison nebaliae]|nr:hypothetical protein SNEBB_010943 [Seison nebaliae]